MTKATSPVLTACTLALVALLGAGCQRGADPVAAPASDTTHLCATYVELADRGHDRVGSARSGAARDAAWDELIATTRRTAAQATDAAVRADLVTVADGMARVAAEPGDLDAGFDSLAKNDPAYFATVEAASDRLEVTCGPITGVVASTPPVPPRQPAGR